MPDGLLAHEQYGVTPWASSVQELNRATQPQFMLGGEGLFNTSVGEVGANPFQSTGKADRLPMPKSDAQLPQQPPMVPPGMGAPQQDIVSRQFLDAIRDEPAPLPMVPPPSTPESAPADEAAPPVAAPEQPAVPRLPDNRPKLRAAAEILMTAKSPALRVQGFQMMLEAQKPSEEEIYQVNRARTLREGEENYSLTQRRGEQEYRRGLQRKQEEATAERTRQSTLLDQSLKQFGADERQSREARLAASLGVKPEDTFKRLVEPLPLSAGQKAVDEAYAKDYAAFKTGGSANTEKSMGQLQDVQRMLADPKQTLTGPIIGITPDWALAFAGKTGQNAVSARQLTEEAIQMSMREVLGAQYTQKEGENLLARAYNPKLSEAENRQRLNRLTQSLRQGYEDKQAAATHYETYGTLSGFKGRPAKTFRDLEQDMEGRTAKQDAAPKKVDTKTGLIAARPAGADDTAILQEAAKAIQEGRNPALIQQQLEAWGVRF